MKNLGTILFAALMIFSSVAIAQDDDDEKKRRKKTRQEFRVELGLNNYLSNGQFPDATDELYTIKPFGSWYVSLGKTYLTPVAGPLFLEWGGDISWYNFKFQNPAVRVSKDANGVIFQENQDVDINAEKSKLVVAYANASFVPMLQLGDRRSSVRIGAGVYAGYKLSSYSKFKYETNNLDLKDKQRDNYYVENIRYGIRARFGYKDVDLFANYDLNNLFISDRGPELNAVSAGIVFSDLFD